MKKVATTFPYRALVLGVGNSYSTTIRTPSYTPSLLTNTQRCITNTASAAPAGKIRMLPLAAGTLTCIAATYLMFFKGAKTPHGLYQGTEFVNQNTENIRIAERLEKHGMVERYITPDGNCQFRALADQIMADQNRFGEVRSKITDWLKRNEGYAVDDNNTACLGDFLDRDQYPSWENYCKIMSGNRAWGDHLTLVAATEAFGINLWILSSVEVGDSPTINGVEPYITVLSPRIAKPSKTARLAHYHELHYTSLHSKDPTVDSASTSPNVITKTPRAEAA